ncbi:bifunctional phosphoribosyl-AMP cyclohydrolase/phosphoribosyl-ATP diphosphatase HisIE [Endozoicomonas sp.]|nr:bifunctional phosphoribosyl-AMP cyclohydrolase/phosphoribosyl-ATP diphosphatase HisIE [Endozoicomonas sp.]
MSLAASINWEKVGGLIPAVIQDNESNQVLMLGYMNPQALAITLETQRVTFWSRSKQRLWTKGETSGNRLTLVGMHLDCDQDTLLVRVKPSGPTCHLGTKTCFDNGAASYNDEVSTEHLIFLSTLEKVLSSRKGVNPDTSYTARLYQQGTKRIAQKVGEEGVETALAAVAGGQDELLNESSDLIYHLLVLLQDQELSLADVILRLEQRNNANKN